MIDYYSLLKASVAYNVVMQEKRLNRLSHAYLFLTPDEDSIGEYLKIFARLILCKESQPCFDCRTCKLIANNTHPDVTFLPSSEGAKILVDDVKEIISKSYVRPLEGDKRIFIIKGFDGLDERSQNKLLKTLEEPPSGVVFLLCAKSLNGVLQTVKSRVKILSINSFEESELISALSNDCVDQKILEQAVNASNKTVGSVKRLYDDQGFFEGVELVKDMVNNMQSSKDVLEYSFKVSSGKFSLDEFIDLLSSFFGDMLGFFECGESGVKIKSWLNEIKNTQGFNRGAVVYVIEHLIEAKKRLKYNANSTMVTDWILFKILEGKYKWQKL